MEDEVKSLITKAVSAPSGDEAMKYSQAACNAAKAWREIVDLKQRDPE